MNNWIIKAIYNNGSHIVMFDGDKLRFTDKQKALDRAEVLNSKLKGTGTTYIVVEDHV